jgi:hypothetical protein
MCVVSIYILSHLLNFRELYNLAQFWYESRIVAEQFAANLLDV